MRRLIGLGGLVVIAAIALLFFYLVYIVAPLFKPVTTTLTATGIPGTARSGAPLYLAVGEQREVALRIAADGDAAFVRIADGKTLLQRDLAPAPDAGLTVVHSAIEHNGSVASAAADGTVRVFRQVYDVRFEGGAAGRSIEPALEFPYGESSLLHIDDTPVRALALSDNDQGLALAVLGASGSVTVLAADRIENLATGEFTLQSEDFHSAGFAGATDIAISGDHRFVYVGGGDGRLQQLPLRGLLPATEVEWPQAPITSMNMLTGGISLLVGDADGRVTQLFPVRDGSGGARLRPIRRFSGGTAPVRRIVVEPRRKGFMTLDGDDRLTLYHATSDQVLYQRSLASLHPVAVGLAPRADMLLVEGEDGALYRLGIDNPHPEVSFSSLWRKVWYENYDAPAYVWQSSAATHDFEPKFSLMPLAFGTLKAALYAMLFAVPLALMGAAYTACFMATGLRRIVKPGIEIMAALPTVILGFLAGLWLAPIVERHLAGLFALLLVLPAGVLGSAWAWHRYGAALRNRLPGGFEPLLQLPVLVVCVWVAFAVADPLQQALFGQDLRSWLTQVAGVDYDQRNALVVGCAMGFAVIPTVFTIAEDAMSGVPLSLSHGSLALGATPWQTLVHVVLPTASPGIFSALMIGFGRAVGETMIVLMATGNTPVMDWSLFDGMRTLAANIAVELPESEVDSTHYRILFLTALVLFVFTFLVNTVADVVRHRLRRRYGSV